MAKSAVTALGLVIFFYAGCKLRNLFGNWQPFGASLPISPQQQYKCNFYSPAKRILAGLS